MDKGKEVKGNNSEIAQLIKNIKKKVSQITSFADVVHFPEPVILRCAQDDEAWLAMDGTKSDADPLSQNTASFYKSLLE